LRIIVIVTYSIDRQLNIYISKLAFISDIYLFASWLVCGGALITTPSASLKLLLIRQLESQIQELWEKVGTANTHYLMVAFVIVAPTSC